MDLKKKELINHMVEPFSVIIDKCSNERIRTMKS